jgi:hypothetical protein
MKGGVADHSHRGIPSYDGSGRSGTFSRPVRSRSALHTASWADPTQLRANCRPCIPGGVRWPVSVRGCATAVANSRRLLGTAGADRSAVWIARLMYVWLASPPARQASQSKPLPPSLPGVRFLRKRVGVANLSLPPLPSGSADRCTHSALGHACHDLRLSVDLPRYILPLPNSRYEKAGAASEQARSKARCGKADDDELAQPKVCCLLNFFSPAAPLRNYLAIDRSSLDVLARCRCIACISSDGKIIVRAYCVREQGPIAAAAAAAAAVPSATPTTRLSACGEPSHAST